MLGGDNNKISSSQTTYPFLDSPKTQPTTCHGGQNHVKVIHHLHLLMAAFGCSPHILCCLVLVQIGGTSDVRMGP